MRAADVDSTFEAPGASLVTYSAPGLRCWSPLPQSNFLGEFMSDGRCGNVSRLGISGVMVSLLD
jgi:hypothetical protein